MEESRIPYAMSPAALHNLSSLNSCGLTDLPISLDLTRSQVFSLGWHQRWHQLASTVVVGSMHFVHAQTLLAQNQKKDSGIYGSRALRAPVTGP